MRAFIALGSNLGDSEALLQEALKSLAELPETQLVAQSDLRRTAPVGGPAQQPDYLNGAALLETSIEPLALLDHLQRIESLAGRDRTQEERWGPRRLDLDLLLHGDTTCSTERLILPHPRMEERLFVLEPLAEIAPELRLPACGMSVLERVLHLSLEVDHD